MCERAEADPSTHHPQTEKRLGPLSLRMTASLMLRISDSGHAVPILKDQMRARCVQARMVDWLRRGAVVLDGEALVAEVPLRIVVVAIDDGALVDVELQQVCAGGGEGCGG